jgi:hypothetical protein
MWSSNRSSAIQAAAIFGLMIASVLAARMYGGDRLTFALFSVSYVGMLLALFPRPHSFVYTFLAIFLFLGFWVKVTALLVFKVPLLEPTGQFNGAAMQWDAALISSSLGAIGVTTARLLHILFLRHHRIAVIDRMRPAPTWYSQHRRVVLVGTCLLIVTLHSANLFLSIYQIGVRPKVILPVVNVVVAWSISIGLAMWAAIVASWERSLYPSQGLRAWTVPFVESLFSNFTLSRAIYPFRILPYLVAGRETTDRHPPLPQSHKLALGALVVIGFAASLATVSLLRITVYPPLVLPSPSPAATNPAVRSPAPASALTPRPSASNSTVTVTQSVPFVLREVQGLFVRRWIGIEGTLAVSSYSGVSTNLLGAATFESPRSAQDALYQRIAASPYRASPEFNFLTTPGAMGVLSYAGSPAVVGLGMLLITLLILNFEFVAARLSGNPLLVSVLGLSLANGIAQMNFPYLFFVLLIEQAVAIVLFSLLTNMSRLTRLAGSINKSRRRSHPRGSEEIA